MTLDPKPAAGETAQWNGKLQSNGTVYSDETLIRIQEGEIMRWQATFEVMRRHGAATPSQEEILAEIAKIQAAQSKLAAPSPASSPRKDEEKLANLAGMLHRCDCPWPVGKCTCPTHSGLAEKPVGERLGTFGPMGKCKQYQDFLHTEADHEAMCNPENDWQPIAPEAAPVPVRIECPKCGAAHIDEGEWATRPHKTHQCQSCGHEWRPFPYATVGVAPEAAGGEKANEIPGPYSIGSAHWNGLSKLIEECGEVVQIAGKLLGNGGQDHHWDGHWLPEELEKELGDLLAAIEFVTRHNKVDASKINERAVRKTELFEQWNGGKS